MPRVEAKRFGVEAVEAREDLVAADAPQAAGERLMARVEPYPGSQRLVRRAWRLNRGVDDVAGHGAEWSDLCGDDLVTCRSQA